MTKQNSIDRINAVCAELESVELRVTQTKQCGQIAASIRMLKKVAEAISDDDFGNERGETVPDAMDARPDPQRNGADGN